MFWKFVDEICYKYIDVIDILLLSIMWNFCYCVGGRLVVEIFLRRGREKERIVFFIIFKVWLVVFWVGLFFKL